MTGREDEPRPAEPRAIEQDADPTRPDPEDAPTADREPLKVEGDQLRDAVDKAVGRD